MCLLEAGSMSPTCLSVCLSPGGWEPVSYMPVFLSWRPGACLLHVCECLLETGSLSPTCLYVLFSPGGREPVSYMPECVCLLEAWSLSPTCLSVLFSPADRKPVSYMPESVLSSWRPFGCLMSQQHAGVSQGRICSI